MAKDQNLPAKGEKTHLYTQGGIYTVIVADETNASRNKQFDIVVPFGPILTVVEDTTDQTNRHSVIATVDNAGEGSVIINWGDDTATSTNLGNGVDQSRHRYPSGRYLIVATDADEPTRRASFEVSVPFQSVMPTLTVAEDTTVTSGLGVSILVDNHGAGEVSVVWGDSTANGTNPGDGTTATTHTYAAGTYTIVVTDANDPHATASQPVTVPYAVTPTMVLSEEPVAPGAERRQVRATITNARTGRTYEALWVAGGTPEDFAAGSTPPYSLLHTYPTETSAAVTVRDKVDTTKTVTENIPTLPFDGPVFTLGQTGTETRGVTATVPGQSAVHEVNWGDGDGTTWTPMAGNPMTLNHTYGGTDQQTFKVSVRPNATPADVSTLQVTVPFPAALALDDASETSESPASASATSTSRRRVK